jgi:hypothetical protein
MAANIQGAENATVVDAGSGRYTFTPAGTFTEPVLGAGAYTGQVAGDGAISGSGPRYMDIVVPAYDLSDNVAFVTFGMGDVNDTFADLFLTLSGAGGAGSYGYAFQMSTATGGVTLVYAEDGVDAQIDPSVSVVAGDRLYFGYDAGTGEIFIKVNDGAAVLVHTLPVAARAIQYRPLFSLMALAPTPVFLAGTVDFTFHSTINGVSGFQTEVEPALPNGAANGVRYKITTAGGPLLGKVVRQNDIIEIISAGTDFITTRATDESALASAAEVQQIQNKITILPEDGVLKEPVIEIRSHWNGLPSEANIPLIEPGLYMLRPDPFFIDEQWAIDMGITGGEILKFDGAGSTRPTIMNFPDGQKLRFTMTLNGGVDYWPAGTVNNSTDYTGILENFSERQEEKEEVLSYVGLDLGDPQGGTLGLLTIMWWTDWCIPMAVAKSLIEPYRRSVGVYSTADSVKGGLAFSVNSANGLNFFEKNFVRKFDSKLHLSGGNISPAAPISFHPKGGFAVWSAGSNFMQWAVNGLETKLGVSGVGGGFKFLKFDNEGRYYYQVSGGSSARIVRRSLANMPGDAASLYTDSVNDPALGWGAITPDGQYLVVGGYASSYSGLAADRTLRVIDLNTFAEHSTITDPGWGAGANAVSGDLFDATNVGANHFVICRSNADNLVHLYNFDTQSAVATRNRNDGLVVRNIAALQSRTQGATLPLVAAAYLNDPTNDTITLEIYDFNSGGILRGEVTFTPTTMFLDEHAGISVSPDGMYLFCMGSIIDISDYTDPKVVTSVPAINGIYSWCHQ